MHKIFIILLSIALTGVLVSQGISEETNLKDEGWKGYKLALVSKGKALKIRTTAQIMDSGKHLKTPTRFKTYLAGKIQGGLTLTLIDENRNKKYNDMGTDVMVLGKSSYGMPLSNMLNIKNKLYHLKVDTEANKVWMKPYEGPTGKVDLVSKYKSLVPASLIILTSDNGDYFDVAKNKKFVLPCGSYSLWLGYIDNGKGKHIAIKGNQMDKIEVKEEEGKTDTTTTVVKWGPPFKMDFSFTVREETPKKKKKTKGNVKKTTKKATKILTAHIPYSSVKVFGSANEEYFNFAPELSLNVEIRSVTQKTTNKEKNVGQQPGEPKDIEQNSEMTESVHVPKTGVIKEKVILGKVVSKGSFPQRC